MKNEEKMPWEVRSTGRMKTIQPTWPLQWSKRLRFTVASLDRYGFSMLFMRMSYNHAKQESANLNCIGIAAFPIPFAFFSVQSALRSNNKVDDTGEYERCNIYLIPPGFIYGYHGYGDADNHLPTDG